MPRELQQLGEEQLADLAAAVERLRLAGDVPYAQSTTSSNSQRSSAAAQRSTAALLAATPARTRRSGPSSLSQNAAAAPSVASKLRSARQAAFSYKEASSSDSDEVSPEHCQYLFW